MGTTTFILALIVFSLFYGSVNYYVGHRLWQFVGQHLTLLGRIPYWSTFWMVALSYLLARFGRNYLVESVRWLLTMVGAYWLGALFYLVQVFIMIDFIRLGDRLFNFLPPAWKSWPRGNPLVGWGVLALVMGIILYGTWNARTPRIQYYELTIPKKVIGIEQLHIVMVSDIHLGEIIHNGRLSRLVDEIAALKPDILLLPGDIVDEDIGPFIRQDMTSNFRRLQPKYGIYAVPGNHEYIGGHSDQVFYYLEDAGIKVLRDEVVKIEDLFYIVGQDDVTRVRMNSGESLKALSQIIEGIDPSLPIVMLKHQPNRLEEAIEAGVDLQLSGHTHRGQLFPNHLITRRLFQQDWGYWRQEQFQLIVSSGFGTWGPPIRLGSPAEIVNIILRFES